MYEKITELKEQWQGCTKCTLHKNIEGTSQEPSIGKGAVPSDLMIVVPQPLYNPYDPPSPYGPGTPELDMLNAITDKLGIDRQRMFVTTTVACPVADIDFVRPEQIIACRPRLIQLTDLIQPKVVMLLGPESMFAWTNTPDLAETSMGVVLDDDHRKVMWSYDFTRYLIMKANDEAGAPQMAEQIFEDWTWIKENL